MKIASEMYCEDRWVTVPRKGWRRQQGEGGGISAARPLLPAPPLPAPLQFIGEFLGYINSGTRN